MSKQSDAKIKQDYVPKVATNICGNCVHRKFDMTMPDWMQRRNREYPGSYGDAQCRETNQRCGLGGFAVKKMGTCKEWGGK